MNEDIKMIEINGVKIEVDLRKATKIENFKVGDNVKVLKKNHSSYDIFPGVIIDFVMFKELPTIQIAYFKSDYYGTAIEFLNFNSKTEDLEIANVSEHELVLEKNQVIDKIDREVEKTKRELEDLENKKRYFVEKFSKYFKNYE